MKHTQMQTRTLSWHTQQEGTVEMAFSPLQVWYPFTPTELLQRGSMEPEQKDRETEQGARQNVLGIHTGTEVHSLCSL